MTLTLTVILKHLLAALVAGALVGTERSFHGRAAGFRTHALVCLASAMLMVLAVYQAQWFPPSAEVVRIDPTRMAQGIMTGIGFLGAGVIFKEGLTVRGLTTAAAIWTTAAIGVLMGAGLFEAGAVATVITLGVLSVFRRIERWFPTQHYAQNVLRFARDARMSEADVRALLAQHACFVTSIAYELVDGSQTFEYRMVVRSGSDENLRRLSETLGQLPAVRGFSITPATD